MPKIFLEFGNWAFHWILEIGNWILDIGYCPPAGDPPTSHVVRKNNVTSRGRN